MQRKGTRKKDGGKGWRGAHLASFKQCIFTNLNIMFMNKGKMEGEWEGGKEGERGSTSLTSTVHID